MTSRHLFTVNELSRVLGVSDRTLRDWRDRGLIVEAKRFPNRRILYSLPDVLESARKHLLKYDVAGVRAAIESRRIRINADIRHVLFPTQESVPESKGTKTSCAKGAA
jgi:DNA-binding transcriptional MerR regulator